MTTGGAAGPNTFVRCTKETNSVPNGYSVGAVFDLGREKATARISTILSPP